MLDNVNLVHMNGRVFDPAIGRFLSADPFIDGAYSTQGWNRYAYVHGRVMSATDPSGFSASRRPAFWNGFTDYWIEITDPLAIRNILGQFDHLTGPALAASEGEPVSVTAREDGIPALDPSSIPMPTLAPVDVYGACDALNEHLAQREQRRQDIDKLAEALQGADVSATAIDGILTEARRLPLGAQLVGVTTPGGWVWTHPSAGLSGPIMPSHGNVLLNSAIRDTASTTLRYVSVAGVGIDGLQVGYEISAGNYDRAAYNAADAAITAGAIRYSGGVGAMFAVGFKMIGGTDTLMKASYLGGLARACSAENGTYVP